MIDNEHIIDCVNKALNKLYHKDYHLNCIIPDLKSRFYSRSTSFGRKLVFCFSPCSHGIQHFSDADMNITGTIITTKDKEGDAD